MKNLMTAALQDEPGEDIAQALEDGWLPIREVARQTGVNAVTLRAWERRYGLIVPQRTPKGHRLFSHDHVQRIHTILTWLNRGVPVSQVKNLIDSAHVAPDAVENEWHTLRQTLVQAHQRTGRTPGRRCLQPGHGALPAAHPVRTTAAAAAPRTGATLAGPIRRADGTGYSSCPGLRSKFGARIYHNNRQLHGAPLLLVNHSDLPLAPHLWLSALAGQQRRLPGGSLRLAAADR